MINIILKIAYFILLPLSIVSGIVGILFWQFKDFEQSINITATIVQTMAIFIGGLWAYHKFGWKERAENAVEMMVLLMEYEEVFNEAARQYRLAQNPKNDWQTGWGNYAIQMATARSNLYKRIKILCYLPKKLRSRILNAVFLTLNKGKSPTTKNLYGNWEKFTKEMEIIDDKLEKIVSN